MTKNDVIKKLNILNVEPEGNGDWILSEIAPPLQVDSLFGIPIIEEVYQHRDGRIRSLIRGRGRTSANDYDRLNEAFPGCCPWCVGKIMTIRHTCLFPRDKSYHHIVFSASTPRYRDEPWRLCDLCKTGHRISAFENYLKEIKALGYDLPWDELQDVLKQDYEIIKEE